MNGPGKGRTFAWLFASTRNPVMHFNAPFGSPSRDFKRSIRVKSGTFALE